MSYCFPRSSIKFQGHTGQNITDFDPNWAFPDYRPVAAFKSLRFALLLHQRALAPRWATPRANVASRRCVVNFKLERTRVCARKLPWRLYPLVERDHRKRISLAEISTPALKAHLASTLRRTHARMRP